MGWCAARLPTGAGIRPLPPAERALWPASAPKARALRRVRAAQLAGLPNSSAMEDFRRASRLSRPTFAARCWRSRISRRESLRPSASGMCIRRHRLQSMTCRKDTTRTSGSCGWGCVTMTRRLADSRHRTPSFSRTWVGVWRLHRSATSIHMLVTLLLHLSTQAAFRQPTTTTKACGRRRQRAVGRHEMPIRA